MTPRSEGICIGGNLHDPAIGGNLRIAHTSWNLSQQSPNECECASGSKHTFR